MKCNRGRHRITTILDAFSPIFVQFDNTQLRYNPDNFAMDPLRASPSPWQPAPPGGRSWSELREAIKRTRRLAAAMLHRVPHTFTFRDASTAAGCRTRLYFLAVPTSGREHTLLYVDVPTSGEAAAAAVTLPLMWRPLLEAMHTDGQLSREEQLLRERKRVGACGITAYEYDEASTRFVFASAGSLFVCDDALREGAFANSALFAEEVKSCCVSSRLDPKLCPFNSNLLGYVSGGDIWLQHLTSGFVSRVTFAHQGLKNLSNDPLSAGVPSFVVQEEFDRYTGYWWQPQTDSSASDADRVYRILYEEVNESSVEILNIVAGAGNGSSVDEYRYPRAGTANATSILKMAEFKVDHNGAISDLVVKCLAYPLGVVFPWMEYLLRAGWTSDGQYVYVQILDRCQRRLQLVVISRTSFSVTSIDDEDDEFMDATEGVPNHRGTEEEEGRGDWRENGEGAPPGVCSVYEDTSDSWINVTDVSYFFPQNSSTEISFIYASEKSGYRHLYYVTAALCGHQNTHVTEDVPQPSILKEVMLTDGDWEVSEKQVWVDLDRQLVYFIGLKDTPLETHLYVVSYTNPTTPIRLTALGYSHCVSLDKACTRYVSVYSSISETPSCSVYNLDFADAATVTSTLCCTVLSATPPSEDYRAPELFSYQSQLSGCTMHGLLYKPEHLQPHRRYPTVLFVYGGPQVQYVTNVSKGMRFLRLHTLAFLDYVVVVLDSRGSSHRGVQFEAHIKGRLGTVEIDDQVEGLTWLASQVDFIDLTRVAIHGWSYGGYLSLMGLAQRPDVFKVAIAGAPVTSWLLYDTGYTERYLGLPHDNPAGYIHGSVLDYVSLFPSEENRLLIVHGLIDENVHFYHTSALITALVKACKPYQLQVYPNERHGIRNAESSEHYETMILSFLQRNL